MNTQQIVLAILAARQISPDAANTLIGTVAKTPAMFSALLLDLTDEDRGAIVSAIVSTPRWVATAPNPAPAAAVTPTAGGTAPERIAAWLRANPGEHTPGAVRQALAMPSGTFGEALATLRKDGTINSLGSGVKGDARRIRIHTK